MKFLADECCDFSMVERLRNEGHRVEYVQENQPGITDDDILMNAHREKKILITEDKDFGELVYRLNKPAYGVILLRFHPLEKQLKIERLSHLLNYKGEKLEGNFIVLDSQKMRIKPIRY